jgi:glycosyltransferase involved in cell wall biosynthesis
MKVLLLQTELGVLRGGGENFSRNLLSAFAERGHEVSAAFFADRLGQYPLALPRSFVPLPLRDTASLDSLGRVVSVVGRYIAGGKKLKPKWDRVQTGIDWRTFKWRQERFQRAVHRELASRWNDFDVVYVHSDVALASQVSKIRPTILRLSGPVGQELKSELLALPAVCANGDALARLRGFLGDHPTEIPIGLDDKLFAPQPTAIRANLAWTEQNFVVGYVGRFHHLKGVDLLASAFKNFREPGQKLGYC